MPRYALLLLLLIPLAAHGQVRCPDGSYRSACPGGDGEAVGAPLSTYEAPDIPSRPAIQHQQQSRPSAPQRQSSRRAPVPDRLMSTADRARDMGIPEADLIRALSRGQILMGMHRRDVERILGRPSTERRTDSGGTICRDLHWRNRGGHHTNYVHMCGGRVQYHNARQ